MTNLRCLAVVELRPRWWVWPYLVTLWTLCLLMGTRPDEARVCAFIGRHGIYMHPISHAEPH